MDDGVQITPDDDNENRTNKPPEFVKVKKPYVSDRRSTLVTRPSNISITSGSTVSLNDTWDSQDTLPAKRKEEVSAEVPKLGISAESPNATQIKTPIFQKNEE